MKDNDRFNKFLFYLERRNGFAGMMAEGVLDEAEYVIRQLLMENDALTAEKSP